MKIVWLIGVLVLGSALVARATEEESNHLQDIQTGRQDPVVPVDPVADATTIITNTQDQIANLLQNPLLAIGNVLGLIDLNAIQNLPGLGNLAGVAAAGGAAAVGTGTIAAASSIKTAVLSLLLKPLDIANGILAIIGLALLIAFVVDGGDIKGLVGSGLTAFRREDFGYDSYSNYVSTARALWDAPIVQRLTAAVQEAIIKYD